MRKTLGAAALLALAAAAPLQQAHAQDPLAGALLGGAAGAIIGGAATGRVGGAAAGAILGGAGGAIIGSQMQPRRGGYYWYEGRCWYRYPNGEYRRVPQRYCS